METQKLQFSELARRIAKLMRTVNLLCKSLRLFSVCFSPQLRSSTRQSRKLNECFLNQVQGNQGNNISTVKPIKEKTVTIRNRAEKPRIEMLR